MDVVLRLKELKEASVCIGRGVGVGATRHTGGKHVFGEVSRVMGGRIHRDALSSSATQHEREAPAWSKQTRRTTSTATPPSSSLPAQQARKEAPHLVDVKGGALYHELLEG